MLESNKKRLALNTIFLYIRMLLLLVINLFTTKVILNVLGASDYGTYNVVGGFVTMLTFLNGAMSNASQRFITYEIGRGEIDKVKNVFAQVRILHIGIALFILLLAETIGLWFINNRLNLPTGREVAANYIYQFSLISTIFSVLSVPYNSLIIAHENMKVYAYIGIYEGIIKLVVCYLLYAVTTDRLILYGLLLSLVSCSVTSFYLLYCKRSYPETQTKLKMDKPKLAEVGAFGGWALCGSVSTIAMTQGVNVIVNMFFNTIVNAARGISYQIDSAVRMFISNFQTAINPQIVKAYSVGDLGLMHSLLYFSSKISFFIMYILALPLIINIDYILSLWLVDVPPFTSEFTRLVLINSLVITFSGALSIAAQATGNIRNYQLFMGSFLLLNLPMSYFLYYWGYPPQSAVMVSICIETFLLFMRLLFLKRMISLVTMDFIKSVLLPSALCVGISLPACLFIDRHADISDFMAFTVTSIVYIIICIIVIGGVGLTHSQRIVVFNGIKSLSSKFKSNVRDNK